MYKFDEEKIKSIKNLHNKGLRNTEISKKLEIPYGTVFKYTKSVERGLSLKKSAEYSIKERGFSSQKKYDEYLKLKGLYEAELKLMKIIESGYDIKKAKGFKDKGDIIIKLVEEEDVIFKKSSVKIDFKEILQRYFQEVSLDGGKFKGKVSYEKNIVTIKADNLESRAFLCAYKSIL